MLIGEILRMAVYYGAANSSVPQNVFVFELQGADVPDATVLTSMSLWIEEEWHPDWSDIASNEVTIDAITLDILNPDGTVERNIGSDAFTGLAGDVISDNDSAAVAAYMQADTAIPKTRGRKYVPGIADTRIENGLINAVTLAQMVVLAATYVTERDLVGGTAQLVPGVLSRTLAQFVPFLQAISVTDVPAYQRRRKPNVGS